MVISFFESSANERTTKQSEFNSQRHSRMNFPFIVSVCLSSLLLGLFVSCKRCLKLYFAAIAFCLGKFKNSRLSHFKKPFDKIASLIIVIIELSASAA